MRFFTDISFLSFTFHKNEDRIAANQEKGREEWNRRRTSVVSRRWRWWRRPCSSEGSPGRSVTRSRKKSYRGVRLYHGQKALCEDFLYLLPQAGTDFPVDTLSYVSAEEIPGEGDHICCPGSGQELLLDLLLEYFSSCLEAQSRMDQLVFQGGGLQELCRLGEMLLGNPICIHDDWFVVAAMSPGAREIMGAG